MGGRIKAPRTKPGGANRRKFGRLRTQAIPTSVGRVVDLSGGGMRVEARWPVRLRAAQLLLVTLRSDAGDLKLHARVSWVRPAGLLVQQAGLEFTRMTPRLNAILAFLAQTNAASDRPSVGWVSASA